MRFTEGWPGGMLSPGRAAKAPPPTGPGGPPAAGTGPGWVPSSQYLAAGAAEGG